MIEQIILNTIGGGLMLIGIILIGIVIAAIIYRLYEEFNKDTKGCIFSFIIVALFILFSYIVGTYIDLVEFLK